MELIVTSESAEDGVTRLRLAGAIDLASKGQLIEAGKAELDEADGLVLNLAKVSFIDSSGVGALVELSRAAEARGKSFKVEEQSPRAERVLTVTGLQDMWR